LLATNNHPPHKQQQQSLFRPEALGIVPGAVFLVCLILCLVGFNSNYTTSTTGTSSLLLPDDPHHPHHPITANLQNMYKILEINTSLLAICFMLFLGFTDDVLDWPWRYKLILPTIASLPIITCYTGSTIIVVPKQLRGWVWNTSQRTRSTLGTLLQSVLGIHIDPYQTQTGTLMDLKYWYLLYMSMLAVFCTNAINIYAGINGLEVGQSYIIACSILTYNCIEILLLQQQQQPTDVTNPNSSRNDEQQYLLSIDHHIFSIMVMVCFIGVTIGLLYHNWYPSKVFVGDTYCYFAGMTFAVVGIFGHYSKTLLLFFIPQILNFLWSTPQLFHFVPCPRHRLPSFQSTTGLMTPSTFPCKSHEYRWLKRLGHQNPHDLYCVNMTLINVTLQVFGPLSERTLCISLLLLQIICCSIGFLLRYYVARFFF
jgi:UDP-N-acetylglucosamine--dolichyl-phosphate N-acetylglucosaminephosphotransferase